MNVVVLWIIMPITHAQSSGYYNNWYLFRLVHMSCWLLKWISHVSYYIDKETCFVFGFWNVEQFYLQIYLFFFFNPFRSNNAKYASLTSASFSKLELQLKLLLLGNRKGKRKKSIKSMDECKGRGGMLVINNKFTPKNMVMLEWIV